ncbi:MAG: SusD/RagB family nutrient-binding outer membrane lipoprotein [Bacteroidia bacterium]
MKNKSKIIIGFSLLLVGLNSCRKGDDLYTNPNQPATATAPSMLSACEVGTFNSLEGGTVRIASIFMQNSSGVSGQAVQPEQYAPIESDMDNYWNTLYPTMLNCKLLQDNYGAADPNYKGIAEVLMAMNLGLTTDMWGDCPYSEAFQGASGNFTPHFDPQQNVLNSIQSLLDQAIIDLANTNNNIVPASDDFIFGGNTTAWTKVAWTLKARYYTRLSKKPGYDPTVVITDLSHGIASNSDNLYSKHGSGGAEGNQWASFLNNRFGYIVASQTLIDSMGNMTDPRTPYYYDTTGEGGVAVGNVIGSLNPAVSNWGPYVGGLDASGNVDQTKSIALVSYAEALFLQAEAEVRLGLGTANVTLNNAIMASVSEVTQGASTGASIATYTPLNTTIHTVILEKWKAMFADPIESYSDYRRTGFPVLMLNPIGLVNYIPKRLPTSEQERTSNPNAPTPALNVPVWYAQ